MNLPNRLDPGPRAAHSRCIDSFGAAPDRLLRRGKQEVMPPFLIFADCPMASYSASSTPGMAMFPRPTHRRPKGGRIMAVRSADDGQSWSDPTVVIDTPQDDRDPSVSCLKDGTLLLDWFTLEQGRVAVLLARSTDQGKTWSEPVHVDPDTHVSFACSAPIREAPRWLADPGSLPSRTARRTRPLVPR